MKWWLWSWVAVAAIQYVENVNRQAEGSFWQTLPATFLPIALAQIALFYTWRDCPKMLIGWACFTAVNSVVRVLNATFLIGEPLNGTVLCGTTVVLLGGLMISFGYSK